MNNSLFTCVVIILLLFCSQSQRFEHFVSFVKATVSTIKKPVDHVKMKRCRTAGVSAIEKNVWSKFKQVDDESWDLFVPCGYTYVENELAENDHFHHKKSGHVLGIPNADSFAAKDRVWKMLERKYGREGATQYMPQTWVTYEKEDVQNFFQYAKSHANELYIMKKNVQQQQGLHIFSDLSEGLEAFERKYVVIQKVLRDPFIINGRKINIRVYVLIVCHKGKKSFYIYDDGFVYYSKAMYNSGTSRDEIITSGYLSRDVYENSPLTTKDFLRYLDEKHGSSAVGRFIESRNEVFRGFMEAAKDNFCLSDKIPSDVIFAQSFGVDLQPDKNLDVKILEWNKGQSLEIMDTRDGQVKQKMIDDIYRTLGLVQDGVYSGFIKVWQG